MICLWICADALSLALQLQLPTLELLGCVMPLVSEPGGWHEGQRVESGGRGGAGAGAGEGEGGKGLHWRTGALRVSCLSLGEQAGEEARGLAVELR
jgi:hypothetical protein